MSGEDEKSQEGSVPVADEITRERIENARACIERSDQLLKEGQGSLEEAYSHYDEAIALLTAEGAGESEREKHLLAWAWMNKGNLFSVAGTEEALQEALACYERAVQVFVSIGETGSEEIYVDFGALRANQGHLVFRMGGREALQTVVRCFQEAIAIFEKLPWLANPRYRHHLIGGWYNLGNVLQWCQENLDTAVDCYRNALDLAEGFEVKTAGHYSLFAGIWLNYGNTLSLIGGGQSLQKTLECYDAAIRLFGQSEIGKGTSHAHELASAWANRANMLSMELTGLDDPQEALWSADQALDLVKEGERIHPWSAEISLKARRARCQAYGVMMHQVDQYGEDHYFMATDEVEDSLNLIRFWEEKGVPHYRPVARRMFHLGAQMYRIRQPHFLVEFVEETLTAIADPELRPIALATVREAKNQLAERRVILTGMEEGERILSLFRELERVERSLSGD